MSRRNASKYFTRHLLRAGMQCPTKLYYKSHRYPEDTSIQPFLRHAGFNKHQLKKLVALQYPNGILINEKLRKAAVDCTKSYLKQEQVILFDAAFIYNQCYAKVPVLVKDGNQVSLIDIQTKAINPRKHRLTNHQGRIYQKWKPYIIDLAYKIYCIQPIYPEWSYSAQLLLPDKTKNAANDRLLQRLQNEVAMLEYEDLFCQLDVTDHVNKVRSGQALDEPFEKEDFDAVLEQLKTRFFNAPWEQPTIGKKCDNCEFRISEMQLRDGEQSGFQRCWNESQQAIDYAPSEAPVLDLIGPGVAGWLDEGICLQKNVPLADLPPLDSITPNNKGITHKQRQTLQVRQAQDKKIPDEIIKKNILEEMNRWQYPLHFLDFEAGNYSIPVRKNRRPYHLVVFQFSCHTIYADGSRTHHQWVNRDQEKYPNYELIRRLMKVADIGEGTIIQYSKFEHYALKKIRKELNRECEIVEDADVLIKWLDDIVQRRDSNHSSPPYLADLSRLVKSFYYNRFMSDSLSIKDVLQSVMTISNTLKRKYSAPYQSSNFNGMRWWQWDEESNQAKSPYEILKSTQQDVEIGRGTEAMLTYGMLLAGSLQDEQKEKAFQALLKYCELDTLAMIMIYEHWKLEQND